jgi:hypothetical protein
VSSGSVYNVIKRHNLGKKWAEAEELKKRGFDRPEAVHGQWHIDFSYIRISEAFYYFPGILDGYSRRMLNRRLCQNMEGINAGILVTETKEPYPGLKMPASSAATEAGFYQKIFKSCSGFWKSGKRLHRQTIRRVTASQNGLTGH